MRTIRRAGAVAVSGLLLSGFVGGAASADTKETYLGGANGAALALSIGKTNLGSFGVSDASLTSELTAKAMGAGAISPLRTVKVDVGVEGADQQDAKSAQGMVIPVQNLLQLMIGEGKAAVSTMNGVPLAESSGTVAGLTLDLENQAQLSTTIGQVQTGLQPLLAGLGGGLEQVGKITGVDLAADDTVDDLLTALRTTRTLDIKLGTSTSTVQVDGDTVTSTAISQGGQIDILPLGALSSVTGETVPVASIIIGSAQATAVYNRVTGESTPTFDPAILTVRVNTVTTDNVGEKLGIKPLEFVLTPGKLVESLPKGNAVVSSCADHPQAVCILEGSPFETRIIPAGGRTITNPDGSVGAEADAVRIQALRKLDMLHASFAPLAGGIDLGLAHAQAGVAGAPAQKIEIPKELPRTGGFPMLPIGAAGALGLAVLTRRLLSRSAA